MRRFSPSAYLFYHRVNIIVWDWTETPGRRYSTHTCVPASCLLLCFCFWLGGKWRSFNAVFVPTLTHTLKHTHTHMHTGTHTSFLMPTIVWLSSAELVLTFILYMYILIVPAFQCDVIFVCFSSSFFFFFVFLKHIYPELMGGGGGELKGNSASLRLWNKSYRSSRWGKTTGCGWKLRVRLNVEEVAVISTSYSLSSATGRRGDIHTQRKREAQPKSS